MRIAVQQQPFRLVAYNCAWCGHNPCVCAPLARCTCACGAILEASDDLEAKRACAERHHYSARHRAWGGW
jgi:hypothetical protein